MASQEGERPGGEGSGELLSEHGYEIGHRSKVRQAQEAERRLVDKDAKGGVGPKVGPVQVAHAQAVDGDGRCQGEHRAARACNLGEAAHARVPNDDARHEEELPCKEVEASRVDRVERRAIDRGGPLHGKPHRGARRKDPESAPVLQVADHERQEQDEAAVHWQKVEEPRLVQEREPEPQGLQRMLEEELGDVGRAESEHVLRELNEDERAEKGRHLPAVDAFRPVGRCLPKALGTQGTVPAGVHPPREEPREEHKALGRRE